MGPDGYDRLGRMRCSHKIPLLIRNPNGMDLRRPKITSQVHQRTFWPPFAGHISAKFAEMPRTMKIRLIRPVDQLSGYGPGNRQYALQRGLRAAKPGWLAVGGEVQDDEVPGARCQVGRGVSGALSHWHMPQRTLGSYPSACVDWALVS